MMRRLPFVLLVTLLAACDRSIEPLTLGPTDLVVAGSYSLSSVNGRTLPFLAFTTSTDEWDLTGDTMVLVADGTWVETTKYNVISLSSSATAAQQTETSGTFAIGSGVITFTRISGGALTFTGSVSGNTLSLLFNGGQFTYSR